MKLNTWFYSLSWHKAISFHFNTPLKLPFRKLLSDLIDIHGGEKPLCVISDFFFGWTADVAHDFGIFRLIFSCTGGFGMACYYSMWLSLPHRFADGDEFLLPDFPEAGKIHVTQVTPAMLMAGENDPLTIFLQKKLALWRNSDGLLLNTVEELDKLGLIYFRRKLGFPFWAIGPLLLSEHDRAKTEEWLPEGFLQNIHEEDKGLVISKWAPQVEILAHKSVAAFISHCRWNSVLESMKYVVPVIGWPIGADQLYNAKFLVEQARVCVELGRGVDFEVTHENSVDI
ncbi:hypothetical protein DH2020_048565 [Rehmannia glutinosa]|uniref:UDP-glycosyltransferase n=1 Tax=Rehmannia glutinosa TaxID=99300 RepID=A0ABR0U5B6_REHGL